MFNLKRKLVLCVQSPIRLKMYKCGWSTLSWTAMFCFSWKYENHLLWSQHTNRESEIDGTIPIRWLQCIHTIYTKVFRTIRILSLSSDRIQTRAVLCGMTGVSIFWFIVCLVDYLMFNDHIDTDIVFLFCVPQSHIRRKIDKDLFLHGSYRGEMIKILQSKLRVLFVQIS